MERFPWLSYSEYKSDPFASGKITLEIFKTHADHKRNSELANNFLRVMSSQAFPVI